MTRRSSSPHSTWCRSCWRAFMTMRPRQTTGASSSTRKPIDMHFTPKFVNGTNLSSNVVNVREWTECYQHKSWYCCQFNITANDECGRHSTCSCELWFPAEVHKSRYGRSKDIGVQNSNPLVHSCNCERQVHYCVRFECKETIMSVSVLEIRVMCRLVSEDTVIEVDT